MSIVIVCVCCWATGTTIMLSAMLSLRMRKRFLREGAPPVPWHAIVALFGLAAAWPVILICAFIEPLLRRRRRN